MFVTQIDDHISTSSYSHFDGFLAPEINCQLKSQLIQPKKVYTIINFVGLEFKCPNNFQPMILEHAIKCTIHHRCTSLHYSLSLSLYYKHSNQIKPTVGPTSHHFFCAVLFLNCEFSFRNHCKAFIDHLVDTNFHKFCCAISWPIPNSLRLFFRLPNQTTVNKCI